jgi:four helix bundle protein
MRTYDLENRLVCYTCSMIDLVESLPNSRAGSYIAAQLIRSCHSPTFNYGEAQAAESRADFIHKLKICLKELKECRTALKIILLRKMTREKQTAIRLYRETEELIAIIAKSIKTSITQRPLT